MDRRVTDLPFQGLGDLQKNHGPTLRQVWQKPPVALLSLRSVYSLRLREWGRPKERFNPIKFMCQRVSWGPLQEHWWREHRKWLSYMNIVGFGYCSFQKPHLNRVDSWNYRQPPSENSPLFQQLFALYTTLAKLMWVFWILWASPNPQRRNINWPHLMEDSCIWS